MKANDVDGLSQLEPVLNWNLLSIPIPSWNVNPGVNRLEDLPLASQFLMSLY